MAAFNERSGELLSILFQYFTFILTSFNGIVTGEAQGPPVAKCARVLASLERLKTYFAERDWKRALLQTL